MDGIIKVLMELIISVHRTSKRRETFLVFLPGMAEILELSDLLRANSLARNLHIIALHSLSPREEQVSRTPNCSPGEAIYFLFDLFFNSFYFTDLMQNLAFEDPPAGMTKVNSNNYFFNFSTYIFHERT